MRAPDEGRSGLGASMWAGAADCVAIVEVDEQDTSVQGLDVLGAVAPWLHSVYPAPIIYLHPRLCNQSPQFG